VPTTSVIRRVFIANRGEVAVRIVRACQKLGLESVVGFAEPDRSSLAVRLADRAICIGPARASESYLDHERVVSAALATGCDAVHPGYGFVAESAEFAELCRAQGLVFVGPSSDVLRSMGDKSAARAAALAAGVPVLPGTSSLGSLDDVAVDTLGFPLLLKAVAGGGGRGIRVVEEARALAGAFDIARREAQASFGDGRIYVEKLIRRARHLEVQVLADGHGTVLHLGERECSVQRRHQKVLEEAPAVVDPSVRRSVLDAAVKLADSLGYQGAGTVEFVLDADTGDTWFIEMNPRLQVEHGVTEQVTGVDIVGQQLVIAAGRPLAFGQSDVLTSGHAIQWRMTAESVMDGLIPKPGLITRWQPPELIGIRIDTHCYDGYTVPPFYDSLLAKLIAYGPTREDAIGRLDRAAASFEVVGVPTTLDLCRAVLAQPDFQHGDVTTTWLDGVIQAMSERQGVGT
jgi:acetyl-CoA carboxylase, biotin carboxylase subunit